MSYQVELGSTAVVRLDFASYVGLTPAFTPGYPKVSLLDGQHLVQAVLATPDAGSVWQATVSVPKSIDLTDVDYKELRLKWELRTTTSYFEIEQLVHAIAPLQEAVGTTSGIVSTGGSLSLTVVLPFSTTVGDTASVQAYRFNGIAKNVDLSDFVAVSGTLANRGSTSVATFTSAQELPVALTPYNLIVSGTRSGVSYSHADRLWQLNPSILTAMQELELMLKKSKLRSVIPALDYKPADLLLYLQRGLAWFNGYPTALTGFDGTDMRGSLRNAWLLCSQYYALMAQLLAESDLGFDFSGQSVTLRVDRAPNIESMLGRIEQDLDRTIRPLKQMLAKAGATSGTGAVGEGGHAALANGSSLGTIIIGDHSMLNNAFSSRRPIRGRLLTTRNF